MPKSILLEPEKLLAEGRIHFSDIEVNAYKQDDRGGTGSLLPLRTFWQSGRTCAPFGNSKPS